MSEPNKHPVIPIKNERRVALPIDLSANHIDDNTPLRDQRNRPIRDLRISVTDRCNFRCTYCMPKEVFDRDYQFLPHDALLTFEEITRISRSFIALGVEKIRLTGGEPLLRKNLEALIEMLASLRKPNGEPIDLTLTTNGSVLERKARSLFDAGLKRITVSLDALDDGVFKAMNDVDFPVAGVLSGIDAAASIGFNAIKINMVVKKGVNDHQVVAMAERFKGTGHIVRFIEYMDVGASNGWRLDEVVPSAEVIRHINALFPLEPIDAQYAGEVAQRWRYRDGSGEVGVISSVTQAFCSDCTRARLSTDGRLYTCLFATDGYDLRALLRDGGDEQLIARAIGRVWRGRDDHYSEIRSALTHPSGRVEMSFIGG